MSSFYAAILSTCRHRVLIGIGLGAGLLILLLRHCGSTSTVARYAFRHNHIDDVYNSTLGFEKVYTISLSERTDKKDLSILAASFAGFQIEYLSGVKAADVIAKAAPSVCVLYDHPDKRETA